MQYNPFSDLPDVGITRPKKAFAMAGIAQSTGYLWISQGRFPRPMRIGPNTKGIPNKALKDFGAKLAEAASAADGTRGNDE